MNEEANIRFFNMLKAAPELARFWDVQEGVAKMRSIQLELSRNEDHHLLMFFCSVWFGTDAFKFDLVKAMKHLEPHEIKIVRRWMLEPFFPSDWEV